MKYLRSSWRRWLGWLVLASLFAVACVGLSEWQFNRRGEKLAAIAKIERNYNQEPANLELLAANPNTFSQTLEWRPVNMTGRYLVDQLTLVRNRPNDGQPGFLEIVPFKTDSGSVIVVERGWLPTGNKQDSPDVVPAPDARERTIVARLRLAEPKLDRGAPIGQIPSIYLPEMKKRSGEKVFYVKTYVRLVSETPGSAAYPTAMAMPELDEGNHLSYAFQWLAFALMAFGALTWAVRQEIRFKRMAADPSYRPVRRKQVGDDDNAAEDAIEDSKA
jgi:cytochrome oxidase assembly protein ShyY1